MHSIVTTFREAVIKVEVANFGAAIDTLIDQVGVCLVSEWLAEGLNEQTHARHAATEIISVLWAGVFKLHMVKSVS